MDVDQRTFIPGRDKLQNGETLSPDLSAYEMLHTLTTEWPCLSFDILRDFLGDNRKTYPATVYAVAGTQAESRKAKDNQLLVMEMSGLSKMDRGIEGSDSEDDSDNDDDEAGDPILETRRLQLPCTTNRIRAHQIPASDSSRPPTTYTATMLENAQLQIHNITPHLSSFDSPNHPLIPPSQSHPLATLTMHRTEGYALSWSPHPHLPSATLLSGDNSGIIHLTTARPSGTFHPTTTTTTAFTGHAPNASVEDIAHSPTEPPVFASASSDGTVAIWDVRSKTRSRPAISVGVSETDVNVLSWSKVTAHLLATGAEDGVWGVWDLRMWKNSAGNGAGGGAAGKEMGKAVASFNFHKEQITSVEWHPTDDSVVAVAAGDGVVTLWDLSVEFDDEEGMGAGSGKAGGGRDDGVPPQVLFMHVMEDVKECHWHGQMPGVVMGTGGRGFG